VIWHKNQTWPNAAERARERAARKLGCVLSRNRVARGLPVPEPRKGSLHIHHLLKPGKRYGHGYSIPLHSWYHEAIIPYPYTSKAEARAAFGASVKQGSKVFLADHGVTEWELYDETQKELKLPADRPATKIMPRRLPDAFSSEAEVSHER
jgi:hypothetical protein